MTDSPLSVVEIVARALFEYLQGYPPEPHHDLSLFFIGEDCEHLDLNALARDAISALTAAGYVVVERERLIGELCTNGTCLDDVTGRDLCGVSCRYRALIARAMLQAQQIQDKP